MHRRESGNSLWRQADYQLNENPRDAAPCNGSGRRQYQALGHKLLRQLLLRGTECHPYRHLFLPDDCARQ